MTVKDLTGQRFGRLVVTGRAENYRCITQHPYTKATISTLTRWNCRCDCGNETVVLGNNLRAGRTQSCGCLRKEWMENRMRIWEEKRKAKEKPPCA